MSKVLINMNTLVVADYDSATRPFHFEVNVHSLQFTKEVTKYTEKQKTNFLGEKMFNIKIGEKSYEVTENQLGNHVATPLVDKVPNAKTVKFVENPLEFTLNDILENKTKQLTGKNGCKLFEVNLQEYVDLNYAEHKADTGYKVIRIHPNGSIRLKVINFDSPIKEASIFTQDINGTHENGVLKIKYSFDDKTYTDGSQINSDKDFNKLYLVFENQTDQPFEINSFFIQY